MLPVTADMNTTFVVLSTLIRKTCASSVDQCEYSKRISAETAENDQHRQTYRSREVSNLCEIISKIPKNPHQEEIVGEQDGIAKKVGFRQNGSFQSLPVYMKAAVIDLSE